MLQVASDPPIHTPIHNPLRHPRSAQADPTPSSESLFERPKRLAGTIAVNPGTQNFTWNGHGNDGRLSPDGSYTLIATAVDASEQSVAISTEVQAIEDSVDLTQDPPQLPINGQNSTLDKIKRIVRLTS